MQWQEDLVAGHIGTGTPPPAPVCTYPEEGEVEHGREEEEGDKLSSSCYQDCCVCLYGWG